MVTVKLGRKWDLTDCETLSAEQNSFNITSWPRGDHNDANDYSTYPECAEAQANCLAEMVACTIGGASFGTLSFSWYDPYGRNVFNWSGSGTWAVSWIGRFGEKNLYLEIYKPGKYKCVASYPEGSTTKYFDVYSQTTNKYLHKQGDDNAIGNSWGAALATWAAAQVALSSGNIIYVGEGDYSSETGFSFTKSQTITPVKATWGGYPNTTDMGLYIIDSTLWTIFDVMNPIEMDGTIDRWAVRCNYGTGIQVKLKIYRGGNAGTANASTSTKIYDSGLQNTTGNWNIYSISPTSVQRGDILAAYCNTGEKLILAGSNGSYGSCPVVSGDVGDTAITGYGFQGIGPMIRAWNSGTNFTVKLPKTS